MSAPSKNTGSGYPAYDVRKILHAAKNPTPDLFMVFAHRGSRALGNTTENSFASVAAAARSGYEGIEIDLRRTKDDQIVVWHDHGLGRNSDVAVPEGQNQCNPFTGKGYNPLVKDTNWFGEMEHLRLRDESGFVTNERPILLRELLDFMRDEGIVMVIILDVKELDVLPLAYEVISKATNAAGVSAMEWCIWAPQGYLFPTPAVWERQEWVQKALKAGQGMAFILLLEKPAANSMDSVKAWARCPYLFAYELHVPVPGGGLQAELDYVRAKGFGVGGWYIGGDVPLQYYSTEKPWAMFWDDSEFRKGILASTRAAKPLMVEGDGLTMFGGTLGEVPKAVMDTRTDLDSILSMGYTFAVADPFTDLADRLAGKRNVSVMMA